jgi:hypothetical protein
MGLLQIGQKFVSYLPNAACAAKQWVVAAAFSLDMPCITHRHISSL